MQLVVIAKEPVAGRVKTRLCPPFSPAQAAALAAAALADTLAAVAATPAGRRVLVLDGRPGPWIPPGFDVIAQRGDGLGPRLAAAVADVAEAGLRGPNAEAGLRGPNAGSGPGPLVIVGMDTPQVTPARLVEAGAALIGSGVGRRRAVLGPADDGGWWLLGLSHPDPGVFAGVPMSTGRTAVAQARQLRRRGFGVSLTARLRDVDDAHDARAVARRAPASRFARCLAAIGDGDGDGTAPNVGLTA